MSNLWTTHKISLLRVIRISWQKGAGFKSGVSLFKHMRKGSKRRGRHDDDNGAASVSMNETFALLPTDVVWYLFSFLSTREIFLLTSCCRHLRALLCARRSEQHKYALFPNARKDDDLKVLLSLVSRERKLGPQRVVQGGALEGLTVRCVASSSQGDYCFAGCKNSTGVVVAWNDGLFDDARLIRISEKKTSVNALKCFNDRLFVGVSKPTCAVHCVDFESGNVLCQFTSHKDSVFAIAVNESKCFSGGGQNDKMLHCSDLETQSVLWVCVVFVFVFSSSALIFDFDSVVCTWW